MGFMLYLIPVLISTGGLKYMYETRFSRSTMKKTFLLLLTLLWSLVEVHSQTEFPYVSFMNETLPNHGYVNLTEVGTDIGNPGSTVRCHTDLGTCCSSAQGIYRGDWYFPNGDRVGFDYQGGDIYETRGAQQVHLYHSNNANSPSGIYRCDIPTNAVKDNSMRETVYVGIYATGGNLCIYDM